MRVGKWAAIASLIVAGLTVSTQDARAAVTEFEIDCSAVDGIDIGSPGIYRLKHSYESCAANSAIRVSVPNVTVDLAGRFVRGTGGGATYGVQVVATATNVKVMNGVLEGFYNGVRVASPQGVVSGIHAIDNEIGIQVSDRVRVSDSVVVRSSDSGIVGENLSSVTRNLVADSAANGIVVGDDSAVEGNQVFTSGAVGITAGENGRILRNRVVGNANAGIRLAGPTSSVSGNTVVANSTGISSSSFDGHRFTGNKVIANSNTGISGRDDNVVRSNTVNANANGIVLEDDNTVVGNTVSGNSFNGLLVDERVNMRGNVAIGNGGNGITAVAVGSTVTANTAKDNGFVGVRVPGLTSGKNKASGNGDAAQCDPVAICSAVPLTPNAIELDCTDPYGFNITSPGSYVLKRAVPSCAATEGGILISSSGVVLDLRGARLGGGGDAGIEAAAGVTDVEVRNGVVAGFRFGIDLHSLSAVTGMVVTGSERHGIIALDRTTVAGNIVVRAGQNNGDGITLGNQNLVKDNISVDNGSIAPEDGTGIEAGVGNTMKRNTSVANDHIGVLSGSGNTVSDNVAVGNGFGGFVADDGNRLTTNRAIANRQDGFEVQAANRLVGNIARGNQLSGIRFAGSVNVASSNTASGNFSRGIDSENSGNVVKRNNAHGNGSHGIETQGGDTIVGNRANGNVNDGIHGGDAGTTVAGNTTNDNGELGIDTSPNAKGEGTNRASGNGFPAQCDPAGFCV